MTYLTAPISIAVGKANDHEYITNKLYRLLRVRRRELLTYSLYKRSIDARNKQDVRFVCSYIVECTCPPQNAVPYVCPQDVADNAPTVKSDTSCVIVGAGAAGLFAALYLVKCGVKVIVVERGSDVHERKKAVEEFFNGGNFSEQTNVQFGLGGAGTFSDGKLTSNLAATQLGSTVFNQFVKHGAPPDILYNSMPHIGTDKLQRVVANMRDEIIACGGRFLFNSCVTDFLLDGNRVTGVAVERGGKQITVNADYTILCCGNGARDVFKTLYEHGADMQFKPFAVGLRIEHSRQFIDTAQYGELFASHRDLGSATYKLTYKCADGHGCYSFCMCPGGVVVAANSERDSVVVNGMSCYARNDSNSNSALVVTVNADDVKRYGYGGGVFAGVDFQRDLERNAYVLGGGEYVAPCQNASDFVNNRVSTSFTVDPSYPRGAKPCNLRQLLPKDLGDNLAEALVAFDRRIDGFMRFGTLTGVETRTSSPVKITRGGDFQSNLKRLYPTGEGAGYSGGIVSSAVDGLKVAMAIVADLK